MKPDPDQLRPRSGDPMTHDADADLPPSLQPPAPAAGTAPGGRGGGRCLPFRTLQELRSEAAPAPSRARTSGEDRERSHAFARRCLSRLKGGILAPDLSEAARFERCIRHFVDGLLREGITLETVPDHRRAAEGVSVYAFYYLVLTLYFDQPSRIGPALPPRQQVERAFAWCLAVLQGRRWRLKARG